MKQFRTPTFMTATPGDHVRVRSSVSYHGGLVGRVSAVRPARGTLPTIVAVDIEPNRQLDFQPHELEILPATDPTVCTDHARNALRALSVAHAELSAIGHHLPARDVDYLTHAIGEARDILTSRILPDLLLGMPHRNSNTYEWTTS